MADEKKVEIFRHPDPFVEITWNALSILLILLFLNGIATAVLSSPLFSNGWAGLTPQGILAAHTRPIASLENPIGARIITLGDTPVYNDPAGDQVGSQPIARIGKILQGPVDIGGDRYWYVDFNKGVDGWVKEKDIAYLETDLAWYEWLIIYIYTSWLYIKFLAVILTIILIILIVRFTQRITTIRNNEQALLYPDVIDEAKNIINPKWEKICNLMESMAESDWRFAIIESDILLDELLDKLSLPGETMGDKLKAVEKSDFTTIDNAWEAHKIRNQIAHEGADFQLSQREARRVIALYQSVFEEFSII